ncbi:molybdopterin-binding protein [Halobacteria archaeon AArc-dxtr1]|nr:molybdopterin-binding protein [Halobacteria archaeon AArc-dxtr1]
MTDADSPEAEADRDDPEKYPPVDSKPTEADANETAESPDSDDTAESTAPEEPPDAEEPDDTTTSDGTATSDDSAGIAVVTISDRESIEGDEVGAAVLTEFKKAGHDVTARALVEKDLDEVQSRVSALVDRDDVDLIVTVGSTGIEPSDVAIEAVEPLLDKKLPAFRDLFHQLSYAEMEAAVITSRAIGGVVEGTPVFCLPNNEIAVRLAVERLIAPQVERLLSLANAGSGGS